MSAHQRRPATAAERADLVNRELVSRQPAASTRTCLVCGHALIWQARRFAWRHRTAGANHAPWPAPVA